MINLGEWVKEARTSAKMTQESLGFELGMTKANVSNMEKGRTNPSFEHILKIAQITNMELPLHDFKISQNHTGTGHNIATQNNFLPSVPSSGSLKKIVMPDNAMLPTFPQGSELTIDTSQTAIIDGKIYEIQSGERFFIRKIFSQISGSLKIVCDNPEFESAIVSSDSVQIVGRVIEWRVRD